MSIPLKAVIASRANNRANNRTIKHSHSQMSPLHCYSDERYKASFFEFVGSLFQMGAHVLIPQTPLRRRSVPATPADAPSASLSVCS